ncbi:MAG: asparagine synthase (glutamine-hydrolyzing) [Paludisphaera borealis]|uniref:asparagine synthase (glutamine-hydrolyzing) n=1 Tax=Paludisphaera borealis TaxID=1387353 RepID=UPI0028484013|nr:asparagine synthase (glutamine-hydrolyzing) [Paludisphaera borealis]MDR3622805.1 asparagine synthase (glutamine-hydrolyzing) [Paludisphaera borealis]
MCGIIGMYSMREPISAALLEQSTLRLAHRGPDGRRTWISEDRRVALGHARLSIIDLATGDQPIASEDESLRIVVNGEFYDFERTRSDLESRGHRFRTRSDSEIALHLYEDFGTACLQQLRGEFAFILWDGPNDTLFAARDRLGIKPLYYTLHQGTLYLASEIKALLAAGVPGRWDHAAFFQANHFLATPQDSTLFEGIDQVPPGCFLLASGGRIRLIRYWDFDYPAADDSRPVEPDAEYAERFRHALDEAVRLRLRADVPVGCYLSGGIDSCAVLGLAATHRADPIRAFTLTFDRADYDEGALAREMAAHAGAEFHPIPIRQSDLADHFIDATWQAETLCFNAHGVAKYLLSRAVRDAGYKVVLTGEGSDEILAGYPPFRRDMLLYNARGQDEEEVRRLLDELQTSNPVSRGLLLPEGAALPLTSVRRALGFVPSWLEAYATAAFRLRSLFAPDFAAEFARRDPYRVLLNGLDAPGQLTGREPVNQSLYLWSKVMLPSYVLTVLGDRMEMAHSVEGRLPFLDHHVVELARSLPISQKIRGITEKYVLREAARPVLTATVHGRHKHPFLAPPAALSPGERLHELMQETLRGPALASLPFYDQSKVVALLDSLPALSDDARTAFDPVLMILLSACGLHERYNL